jgi:hypothetical protein
MRLSFGSMAYGAKPRTLRAGRRAVCVPFFSTAGLWIRAVFFLERHVRKGSDFSARAGEFTGVARDVPT